MRWIESLEVARLTVVVFHRMHLWWRRLFLPGLLVVHRVVEGSDGALQNQGCNPSLLGRPRTGLELCRQDGSDCTHDCIRADAMGVPDATIMVSTNQDGAMRDVWTTIKLQGRPAKHVCHYEFVDFG